MARVRPAQRLGIARSAWSSSSRHSRMGDDGCTKMTVARFRARPTRRTLVARMLLS
jgi:hypothetical protein